MFESSLSECPRFSPEQALEILFMHWEISGTLKPLDSYQDQNFLVKAEDGSRYTLKIANAATPEGWLDLQNRVMAHLADQTPPLPTPVVVPTRHGTEMTQAEGHWWRLVSFLPGIMLSDVPFRSHAIITHIGAFAGNVAKQLSEVHHPHAKRPIQWDLQLAPALIESWLSFVDDTALKSVIADHLQYAQKVLAEHGDCLRKSIIHGDITRYNLLLDDTGHRITGLIDFGDVCESWTVGELAVTLLESVMTGSPNPVEDALVAIHAFQAQYPLTETEIEVLPALLLLRSCAIVCASARQLSLEPANAYVRKQALADRETLWMLTRLDVSRLKAPFRAVCGWVGDDRPDLSGLIAPVKGPEAAQKADRSPVSVVWHDGAWLQPENARAQVGHTPFLEPRMLVQNDADPITESGWYATGTEILGLAGVDVRAVESGSVQVESDAVIVHHTAQSVAYYSVYRHIESEVQSGDVVEKGAVIGRASASFRFQISLDPNPPFFVRHDEKPLVEHRVFDPSFLFDSSVQHQQKQSIESLSERRKTVIQQAQEYYYQRPMNLVRGWKQYLTADDGRTYLDAINNVAHVGHSHPHVREAIHQQMYLLNTNARFLYAQNVVYAERLLTYFPEPLRVVFFVCTGSEANDLALRLARAYTGQQDIMVIDGEYHGNTTAVDAISTNLMDNPTAAKSSRPFTHPLMQPNTYRGRFREGEPDVAMKYAQDAADKIERLKATGRGLAGFLSESLLGSGGGVEMPDGYLREIYRLVREAGGVCIADEVQIGFGRMGTHFWGFEKEGVLPDIVTLGKPMGNGHPISAVVTTPEIADAYRRKYTYFNTFAGNAVSAQAAQAVLDVIEKERLQENAHEVGSYLKNRLCALVEKHERVGAVYGHAFYLGVDIVKDKKTRQPGTHEAMWISERMRQHGIIIYPTGDYYNILKIKPPMCFTRENADALVETLDQVLVYMD